jgi:hypothetical protein
MRKDIHPRRGILRDDSGQAMTEAVIGLSLTGFVWAMIAFMTWMASNHIRTAMAARHAAWMAGNGGSPTQEALASAFFYESSLVHLEEIEAEDTSDLLGGGLLGDVVGGIVDAMGGERFAYKVSYGLEEADIGSASFHPFNLLNVVYPFAGNTMLSTYLKVDTSAQWEDVNEIWDDALDVIESILGL